MSLSKVNTLTTDTFSLPKDTNPVIEGKSENPTKDNESTGEINRTDPKVCHDPTMKIERIARIFLDQNKFNMEDKEHKGDISTINKFDNLKLDAIEYPLVVINERNVENYEIVHMTINYDRFLPTISITIQDVHESEQKINTTQMSSIIKVVMVSPIDKVYRKIALNFRILNMSINPNDRAEISYFGEFYVEGFRNVNTMHIWMPSVCPKPITCQQGGHINANTWEMLHKIASMTGLGFAATKQCKEIPDHTVRHIHTQRFNEYIEQQLLHCGTDVDNLFDAWVDLYGYIVMVNIPWVLNEKITYKELTITASTGVHYTSNDLDEQKPQDVVRTLTNHNLTGIKSNMEIESYNMVVKNESVEDGTLERIYPITMMYNGRFTKLNNLDIQTKQNSVDGEHIEEYNTGKRRPIPKFDFNEDAWTGLSNGYDLNTQKRIRLAYLKKIHQSELHVKLKTINFGLQRGTLVNIAIFDNDAINKDVMLKNASRLKRKDDDIQEDKPPLPKEVNLNDIINDDAAWLPNVKLSGLYYIDRMKFEYDPGVGKIDQTLYLVKKGITSGYMNKFNGFGVPKDKFPGASTLPHTTYIEEEDKV